MHPTINSKLPDIGTTIFTRMSVLANEHKAINLGQGFPDYAMPQELVALVDKAMRDGHNQYVHMNGLPLLRQRLSEKISTLYGNTVDPETEITVTPGGTYAIYTALTTVLQPGDEVIVFEPAYDSYIPNIEINGAVPVLIPLVFPGYHIDWNLVRSKITPKTKMIMLNTPHNPTGVVLEQEDITALKSIVAGTGIFILSDEVYEHLIFDGKQHLSMLRDADLYARSFVCFSFGKVYDCTGWKMGYCVAPPALTKEFRKVHQFNCFSCNSPVQVALAEFIRDSGHYLGLGARLQQQRDHFAEKMKATKFKALPSYGSYFQLYSYADISDESEMDFAVRLTKEYGVTSIPVSAFYENATENRVLRFCFSKTNAVLDAAVERLLQLK